MRSQDSGTSPDHTRVLLPSRWGPVTQAGGKPAPALDARPATNHDEDDPVEPIALLLVLAVLAYMTALVVRSYGTR